MLTFSRLALALFFIGAGAAHFIAPTPYLAIMPPGLPWPAALVFVSGVAEIAGGAGVLWRRTRRFAGLGLVLLLIAVFPANIYAAMHGMQVGGRAVAPWILWLRLPVQAALVAWVYFTSWKEREVRDDHS
jgi:uncharacterized membrane protein